MVAPLRCLWGALGLVGLVACDGPAAMRTAPAALLADEPPAPSANEPSLPPCPLPAIDGDEVAATTRGLVEGERLDENLHQFLGIPFAAPPVGELRFRAPEPHACWPEVREAKAYGNWCPQELGLDLGNEDCLTLNVWTHHVGEARAPRPVLVWIHGGANLGGSAYQFGLFGNIYDGRDFVTRQDVVVVSMNYRLGPLGFLAHPALAAESPTGASGNYGLLDILMALRWVQDNIANFGGDPRRVTVFGESAGAWNICMLLSSPLAAGLFHGAIMQSGSCAAVSRAEREAQGQALGDAVGCGNVPDPTGCLRARPAELFTASMLSLFSAEFNLADTWRAIPFGPTIDGTVVPDEPLAVIERGEHNRVPLIIGTNAAEAELFLPVWDTPLSCRGYADWLAELVPDSAAALLELYPCRDYPLPRWAAVALGTDLAFRCEARRVARAMASHGTPVFRYGYNHAVAYGPLAVMRACHAIELPFLFDNYLPLGYAPLSSEREMGRTMQGLWAGFAARGEPNVAGLPYWPRYEAGVEAELLIDLEFGGRENHRAAQCDQLDTLR